MSNVKGSDRGEARSEAQEKQAWFAFENAVAWSGTSSGSASISKAVVHPEWQSTVEELRDILPHYVRHLAPHLQKSVTQQLLHEASRGGAIRTAELPNRVSSTLLGLLCSSEDSNRDSGSTQQHRRSALTTPSQSVPSSSQPSPQPSLHHASHIFAFQLSTKAPDNPAPTAAALHGQQRKQPQDQLQQGAQLAFSSSQPETPQGGSPQGSFRRAQRAAGQEALASSGSGLSRADQKQNEDTARPPRQLPELSSSAPASPMNVTVAAFRRCQSFVEAIKSATANTPAQPLDTTPAPPQSQTSLSLPQQTLAEVLPIKPSPPSSPAPRQLHASPAHSGLPHVQASKEQKHVPKPSAGASNPPPQHPSPRATAAPVHALPQVHSAPTGMAHISIAPPKAAAPPSSGSSESVALHTLGAAAAGPQAEPPADTGNPALHEYNVASKGLGVRSSPHGADTHSPFGLKMATSSSSGKKKEGPERGKSVGFMPMPSNDADPKWHSAGASARSQSASAIKLRSSMDSEGTTTSTGQHRGDLLRRMRSVSFAVPNDHRDDDNDDNDDDGKSGRRGVRRSKSLGRMSRHRDPPSNSQAQDLRRRRAKSAAFIVGLPSERSPGSGSRAEVLGTIFGDGQDLHIRLSGRSLDLGIRQRGSSSSSRDAKPPSNGGREARAGGRPRSSLSRSCSLSYSLGSPSSRSPDTTDTLATDGGGGDAVGVGRGSRGGSVGVQDLGSLEHNEGGAEDSGDSSNSEEDVSKAVAKLLRRRYPTLAATMHQMLEVLCKSEELLVVAAAPAHAQQQSLDALLQNAIASLLRDNYLLRASVLELESFARSSSTSTSSRNTVQGMSCSSLGAGVSAGQHPRPWLRASSLGRAHNVGPPLLSPTHGHATPPLGMLMTLSKARNDQLLQEVWAGQGSFGGSGGGPGSSASEHSSAGFSELTLAPLQLKRTRRSLGGGPSSFSSAGGSLPYSSHSLRSSVRSFQNSLSHRWSSSQRSSVRSRSSARSSVRSRVTTSSKQEEEGAEVDPDELELEKMEHDAIAAAAAASLRRGRAHAVVANTGHGHASQGGRGLRPCAEDEGPPEGAPQGWVARRAISGDGTWASSGRMTPYGLQALHERVSGSGSGSAGGSVGTEGAASEVPVGSSSNSRLQLTHSMDTATQLGLAGVVEEDEEGMKAAKRQQSQLHLQQHGCQDGVKQWQGGPQLQTQEQQQQKEQEQQQQEQQQQQLGPSAPQEPTSPEAGPPNQPQCCTIQ